MGHGKGVWFEKKLDHGVLNMFPFLPFFQYLVPCLCSQFDPLIVP